MKIKVKGQDFDIRITFGGILRYNRETGKDLQDLGNGNMPLDDVNKFIFCNFESCAKADGKNIDGIEMLDVLDSMDLKAINEFLGQAGMEINTAKNEMTESDDKKK